MGRLSKLVGLQNIVCQVASLLHSLRTKLSIAGQPNHPKVFMWSSLWEQRQTSQPTAVDNSLELFLAAAGDAFGCETAATKLTTPTSENSGYNSQTELSTELQLRDQNKFLDCLASPNNHIGTFNFCKERPVAGGQSSSGISEQPAQIQLSKSISCADSPSSCDSQLQLNGDIMETIDTSHRQVKEQVSNGIGSETLCTSQNYHPGVVSSGQEQLKPPVSGQAQIKTFESDKGQIKALDSGNKQPEPFSSSQQQLEARISGQLEQEALENSKEYPKHIGRGQEQRTTLGNTLRGQIPIMGSGQEQQLEAAGSSQQKLGALGSGQEQQSVPMGSSQQQLGALGSGQDQLGTLDTSQEQLGALGNGQEQRLETSGSNQQQLGALGSGQEQFGTFDTGSGQEKQLETSGSNLQQLGELGSGQDQLGTLYTSHQQLGALGGGQDQLGTLDTTQGQLSLPDFEFPSLNEVAQLLPGVLQDISQSIILNEHPGVTTTTNHQQQQTIQQQQHANLIPEPKLIDREECRANLVHHIEFLQV
ncbi:MAG: DUF4175 domain-containing protein [Gammaproteobacteria bacterium]|nr:DUF4175 domain-containing protein [Gammaproteobacteria bacterium]